MSSAVLAGSGELLHHAFPAAEDRDLPHRFLLPSSLRRAPTPSPSADGRTDASASGVQAGVQESAVQPMERRTQLGRRRAVPNIMNPAEVGIYVPEKLALVAEEEEKKKVELIRSIDELIAESPSSRLLSWHVAWDRMMRKVIAMDIASFPPGPPRSHVLVHFFSKMDKDGGGEITMDEMREQWRPTFGSNPDQYDLMALFQEGDQDCDGQLSWQEFERLCMNVNFSLERHNLKAQKRKETLQGFSKMTGKLSLLLKGPRKPSAEEGEAGILSP
ncbi:hypothetical protein CYMTET_56101 [Cymbomonas tetramitiformis]|uniref:EF-hand domain-containing protein n=1 Tax=Cymbomonas tetramitiformis TaxID=36881 RepID=A0AAE0BCY8_9CHLO|nr:hypothetical protein CYMTET_56101 [Cymbomonas tetramitiformis]